MWNDLSMADKAKLISVAVQNGITNLNDIQTAYNTFAEGGSTVNPGSPDGIGSLDGIVSPSDINMSNINKDTQRGVDFGKFANSYWGQRIIPVLDIMHAMQTKKKLSTREQVGITALLGDGISTVAPGAGSIVALPLQAGDIYYDHLDYYKALYKKLFTKNNNTWDDVLEAKVSAAADVLGLLPYAPAQAVNTADDFLQLSGNSLYRDLKNKYIAPWFPLGHWLNPYQLGEAHVNTTKEEVAKAKEALKKHK